MSIDVKIVTDSRSSAEPELRCTTFLLRYPRFIHSEFMTHRVLSRNASSSRAIPIPKVIAGIRQDPAVPVMWGRNQPGMQSYEELTGWRLALTKLAWYGTMQAALLGARLAHFAGAHKQVANRMLEPWSHITVVATGTDWENFFELRAHSAADPTFHRLAAAMKWQMHISSPQILSPGQWHLPFIKESEDFDLETAKKVSAARCASTSYNKVGTGDLIGEEDALRIFDKLIAEPPIHASPFEHQATPDRVWSRNRWANPRLHGNLNGFVQYRKEIEYA